jgi:flagellar basal body rod protein FlgG
VGAFIDIASGILTQATSRVEINAQNIANISTPGYKRRLSFSEVLADRSQINSQAVLAVATDLAQGKPIETGNHSDLAISGPGFFTVRSGDQTLYTRGGQFQRDGEGRLVTADGMALQAEGGGDIVVRSDAFEVTSDGTVLEGGEPVTRLAIVTFADPQVLSSSQSGLFAAVDGQAIALEAPVVRQGFLEASNVSTGDEMVSMMESLRRAETGQRLVTVYDELMGRVLSTFGQT